jgi:hypothetical protein
MSILPGTKRGFPFGQNRVSWCTRCNGRRCKEDVVFICDNSGHVKGYIIDSELLSETGFKEYSGYNKRRKDSPPTDGIYKRPLDVKRLLSRDPASVKTVAFSDDVLNRVLVGVEACDDFVKGVREAPYDKLPECLESMNLNRKAEEVLSGKTNVTGIKLVKGSEQTNYRSPGSNPLTRGY